MGTTTERTAPTLKPLPYGRQWIDDDDVEAVVRVLRGDWLTQGPAVVEFERALAESCGARYAVAVSSGTAALHLACLAAGVGPGDVGVTSPITFVASANCVAYCGGTVAFADIDAETVTLDPAALDAVCRRAPPKVVIPVDFSGQTADLPAIQAVAQRYGAVIEDAAHALGATYRHDGRTYRAGSCAHSDMATLSFHPVKHVTTGEGGAVLTNDADLYARLSDLRSHGITKAQDRLTRNDGPWFYEQHDLGFNYRITDIQCALGLSQLARLGSFLDRRRELVERYLDRLSVLSEQLTLLTESPDRRSSYHLMVVRLKSGGAARRLHLFERLREAKIFAQVHYIPVHLQPWYRKRSGFAAGDFPRAESYYEGCLSLPLYPKMSDEDVDRVAGALRRALESAPDPDRS